MPGEPTCQEDLGIPLRDYILTQCPPTKGPMTTSQITKFIEMLTTICAPQESDPYGQSQLQTSPVDLSHWYEVQNVFHSYFSSEVAEIEVHGPLVFMALRTMLIEVQKIEFFALYDCILELVHKVYHQETSPSHHSNKWHNLFEMFEIMDIVESKLQDKTHSKLVFENSMFDTEKGKQMQKNLTEMFTTLLSNYWASSLMVIFEMGIESQMSMLREIESDIEVKIAELKEKFGLGRVDEIHEFFLAQSSAIQVALMTKFYTGQNKKLKLEEALRPKQIFTTNLIILQSEKPCYPLKVGLGVLQVMHCFIQLDLVRDMGYRSEKENPFFLEAVRHCQTYALLVSRIAQAQLSIKPPGSEKSTDDVDMPKHPWHGRTTNETSQRYLSYFVRFIDLVVRTRTSSVQIQLYPQLVEPLIAICTVKPKDGYYLMNIGCQKNALKVVKEITKVIPFENTRQLNLIIERLQCEVNTLVSSDLNGDLNAFKVHPNDDTQRYSYSLQRRQSFISNVLRFLCFAIIRMDPAAVTEHQMLHSTKIFESELFKTILRQEVFVNNRSSEEVSEKFAKVIDPIFLPCIQLYTYVLNDLPKMLTDCNESGLITDILSSMQRRIPLQADFMLIVMKFLNTLHLNADSSKILCESQVLEHLFVMAKDCRTYKLMGQDLIYQYREVVHNFVCHSQEMSDRTCRVIIENLQEMVDRAWIVTGKFIAMEKRTEGMTDSEKQPHKEEYGREQLALEQCLESSVALLDFYFQIEFEYAEHNPETFIGQTFNKEQDDLKRTLDLVLKTPIIASAADNYIYHFQETATLIAMVQKKENSFEQHLKDLWHMILGQLNNVRALLVGGGKIGVGEFQDLDNLLTLPDKIPTSGEVTLAENASEEQAEQILLLKGDDQLLVAISKLHVYFNMILMAETLSKGGDRNEMKAVYIQSFTGQLLVREELGCSLYTALYKVQSLLKRGYSALRTAKDMLEVGEWERNVKENLTPNATFDILGAFELLSEQKAGVEFPSSLLSSEIVNDTKNEIATKVSQEVFDLAKLSEQNTIKTMKDRNIADVQTIGGRITPPAKEGVIDWQLYPESDGFVATVKFYKKQRSFMTFIMHYFNRKRVLFKDPINQEIVQYNMWFAQMISDEIKLIAERTSDEPTLQIGAILFVSSELNFILPNLSKMLMSPNRNLTSGFFLTEVLNKKNDLLRNIMAILQWSITQMYLYETATKQSKMVSVVHSLQEIQRHCLCVIRSFVSAKYVLVSNVNIIVAFKEDQSVTLENPDLYLPLMAVKLRHFLYQSIFEPAVEFLLQKGKGDFPPALAMFDQLNPLVAKELVQLAVITCQGFRQGVGQYLISKESIKAKIAPEKEKKQAPHRRNTMKNDLFKEQLMEMGFDEEEVVNALESGGGDFEKALDQLTRQREEKLETEQQQEQEQEVQKTDMPSEADIKAEVARWTAEIDTGSFTRIMVGLQENFIKMVTDNLTKTTVEERENLTLSLLNTVKSEDKNENTSKMAANLIIRLFTQAIKEKVPDWLLTNLTSNVMTYHRANFSQVDVYSHLDWMSNLFSDKIKELTFNMQKYKSADGETTELKLCKFNIKQHMELLFLVFEEIRTHKDLELIREMVVDKQSEADVEEKGLLEDLIAAKKQTDLTVMKGHVDKMEALSVKMIPVFKDKEQTARFLATSMKTLCDLLRTMSQMPYQVPQQARKSTFIVLVSKTIQLLKSLAKVDTLGSTNTFSFRQIFQQQDLVKLLFDVKMIDQEWESPKESIHESLTVMQQELTELLVLIRGSPQQYQKSYETQIKNTMFLQFRENFKRGETDRTFIDTFFTTQQPQAEDSPKRNKKSQSKVKTQQKEGEKELQPVPNKVFKKLIKKYEMYNEADFKEFLANLGKPMITDIHTDNLSAFLAACNKVCILKHVLVKVEKAATTEKDEEQKGEEKEEYKLVTKIILKRPILREFLTDTEGYITTLTPIAYSGFPQTSKEFLNALASKGKTIQPKVNMHSCSKQQTELLNQLLDILLSQTKGYKMDILKHLRDPTGKSLKGSVQHSLDIDQEKVLLRPHTVDEKMVPRNIFLFGFHSIIQIINMLLLQQNELVGVILRHNDAKTIKFIFRNLFFLAALEVEGPSREIYVKDMDSRAEQPIKLQLITFLTRLLLEDVHSTRQTKKLKRELQQIFISQLSTNLLFKYPKSEDSAEWSKQSQLLLKYGQVWMLQKFLAHKEPQVTNIDKAIVAIWQKNYRLWTVQRNTLTKHLVLQCQKLGQADQHDFIVLNQIQELMQGLQTRSDSYFFWRQNQRQQAISLCVKSIASVMRPLEAVFDQPTNQEEYKEGSLSEAGEAEMEEDEVNNASVSFRTASDPEEFGSDEEEMEEGGESESDSQGSSDSYGEQQFDELSSEGPPDARSNTSMLNEELDEWDQPVHDSYYDEDNLDMDEEFDGNSAQIAQLIPEQDMNAMIRESKINMSQHSDFDENQSPIQLRPVLPAGDPDSSFPDGGSGMGDESDSYGDEEEVDDGFDESEPLSYDEEQRSMLSDRPVELNQEEFDDNMQESYDEYEQYDVDQEPVVDNEFLQFDRAQAPNQTHIVFQMDRANMPHMQQSFDGGNRQQFQLNMDVSTIQNGQLGPFRNEIEQQLQANSTLPQHMIPEIASQITKAFSQKLNPIIKGQLEEYLSPIQVMQFLKQAKMTEGLYYLHMQSVKEVQPEEGKEMELPLINTSNIQASTLVQDSSSPQASNNQRSAFDEEPKRHVDNPLELEGMDPLFMENLDPMGLQNIADSRQIHNAISNQNAQASTNPTTGQNIFTNLQDINTFIRSQPHVRQNELLRQFRHDMIGDLQPDLQQMVHAHRDQFESAFREVPQQRQREHSIDSESLIVGATNDQFVDHKKEEKFQDIALLRRQQEEQAVKKRQVRGSTFVQNLFQSVQSAIQIAEQDPLARHLTKLCEATVKEALIADPENDSIEAQLHKVRAPVNIAVCGFRSLSIEEKAELASSIKLLHRIPNLRHALTLEVLKLARIEFDLLASHARAGVKIPFEKCAFHFGDADATPAAILMAFKTINDMQNGLKLVSTGRKNEMFDIIKPLSGDNQLSKFAQLVGDIDTEKSVLEGCIDLILSFIHLVTENKWIVHRDPKKCKIELNDFFDLLIESVSEIVRPMAVESKKQRGQTISKPLTHKICDLMLFDAIKVSKKSSALVRKTLTALAASDPTCAQVIHHFLDQRTNLLLKDKITSLTSRCQSSEVNIFAVTSIQVKAETEKIQELLKIAASLHDKSGNEECICDEEQLEEMFTIATELVRAEDKRISAMNEQETQTNKQNKLVIFKPEIQELMLLIFSICEYNLKFIESSKQSSMEVKESSTVTVNIEVDTICENYTCTNQSKARLRTIVTFFICNKSLINQFIRVNQHFASNVVLRNLIVKIPQILAFDTKRLIWRLDLKRRQAKYKENGVDIRVNRQNVFEESYNQLVNLEASQWKKKFAVEFDGEEGIDAGGLIKEWFILLSKWIFNDDNALFMKSEAGSTYYPNPKSTVQTDYLKLFTFVGKIFGKALWDQQLLECYFIKAFYKIILGMKLTNEDVEDYDQALYKSQQWLLNNDNVQDIGTYFVETLDYFGESKDIELCENGSNTLVTDQNKLDYVTKVANYRLYGQVRTQIEAFMKGFSSIVPTDLLKIFDNRELELLMSGLPTIDIDDLKENTTYEGGYNPRSKPVTFLFQVLHEYDAKEKSEFLQFVTGSPKVPVEGFKGLRGSNGLQKFKIVRVQRAGNRLPQSHSCFNQLDLPEYRDKETTKKMLTMAIKEGKTFGLA